MHNADVSTPLPKAQRRAQCCGCIPLRSGVIFLLGFTVISSIVTIVFELLRIPFHYSHYNISIVNLVFSFLLLIFAFLGLIGAFKKSPRLVRFAIPGSALNLIWTMIVAGLLLPRLIYLSKELPKAKYYNDTLNIREWSEEIATKGTLVAVCIFSAVLDIYYMFIFNKLAHQFTKSNPSV